MIASLVAFVAKVPVWLWKWVLLALALLVAVVWFHARVREARDDGAQTVRDSLAAVTAIRLHHAKDSVGERIVRDTVVVARTVQRTDTLWQQLPEKIVTRADTVQVLNSLPALRVAADSAIQSCSELTHDCAHFRVYADSLDKARIAQIAGLNARLASATRTSRLAKYQTVLVGALAFYLGRRFGR